MTAIISKDSKYVLRDEVDDTSEPDMVDLGTWFYGADFGTNDHGNPGNAIVNELFDSNEEKYEKFWHTGNRFSHAWWNRLRAQAKKQDKRIALILCPSNHNNQNFHVVENRDEELTKDEANKLLVDYTRKMFNAAIDQTDLDNLNAYFDHDLTKDQIKEIVSGLIDKINIPKVAQEQDYVD